MIVFSFIFLGGIIYAADEGFPKADLRGEMTENFSSRGLQLNIYTEKSRYEKGDDVILRMELKNNGFYPITLFQHLNRRNNFTVIARTKDGKSLSIIDPDVFLGSSRNQSIDDYKDPFFTQYTGTDYHSRAIVLKPSESFVSTLRLNEYVNIPGDLPDQLNISSFYYPNPKQSPDLFVASKNSVRIFFDNIDQESKPNHRFSGLQNEYNQPLSISPKETVYLMLSAEYSKDWPVYFKYISLVDILRDYPEYARLYMKTKNSKKGNVLQKFRNFLMHDKGRKLLRFRIINEGYTEPVDNARTSSVQVKAMRELEGFRREFLYTYYLTRVGNFWQISGIETQLLN